MNTSGTACCSGTGSKAHPKSPRGWNITYLAAMTILAVFWWLAYSRILSVAHRLVFGLLGMAPESRLGAALEFFIYDTVKILLLLAALIYIIAWMRASLNIERVRDRLAGKRRGLGCFLARCSARSRLSVPAPVSRFFSALPRPASPWASPCHFS